METHLFLADFGPGKAQFSICGPSAVRASTKKKDAEKKRKEKTEKNERFAQIMGGTFVKLHGRMGLHHRGESV
ncbi:MAG: hypothetical protein ACI3XT_05605 [Butyricicoccaceae bacterium]